MNSSNLDPSIDTVARGMTAGEPSAQFRERVAARLDQRRGTPWFWIGGTLLAAGAAVVLMVVTRAPVSPDLKVGGSVQSASAATSGPQIASSEPRTASSEPRTASSEPRTFRSGERPAPSPVRSVPSREQLAWESRAIPALTPPEPSAMPDIQPEPLEIRPLVTPALIVLALGEDDDR